MVSRDEYFLNINLSVCGCLVLSKTAMFLLSVVGLSSIDTTDAFFQLWTRSKKMCPTLLCFDKEMGKMTVRSFLFEQLSQRLRRGKIIHP